MSLILVTLHIGWRGGKEERASRGTLLMHAEEALALVVFEEGYLKLG